jgi:hypothetical protein
MRIFPAKMFILHLLEDRLEDPLLSKIGPAYKVVFIFGCIVRKAGSNLDALLAGSKDVTEMIIHVV